MTKQDVQSIIQEEKELYVGLNYSFQKATHSKRYLIWKYLFNYRKTQFYMAQMNEATGAKRLIVKILFRYYIIKKNKLSEKCGVEIANGCRLGKHLDIWHGGVIINGDLGDNCVLHGNNIIGNKGIGRSSETPRIGNGVDIGAGAVIIGNIQIADNCTIGANAVVTKSINIPNSIVVGVPGRIIEK